MKRIYIIIVLGLLLSACTSSVTKTVVTTKSPQIITATPLHTATTVPTVPSTPTQPIEGEPIRILFIGSSHIHYTGTGQDIAKTFAKLAEAGGHAVIVDRSSKTGVWLMDHLEDRKTKNKLKKEWDYVVLQEDMYMSARESDREEYMYPAVRALDEEIGKSGAETIFFITWVNPLPIYEGRFDDYVANQKMLTEGYMNITEELDALTAPVGLAIENSLKQRPDQHFWASGDEHGHSNTFGTYLAACVFYALIFQETPEGLSFVYQPEETYLYLQSVAADTVLKNSDE